MSEFAILMFRGLRERVAGLFVADRGPVVDPAPDPDDVSGSESESYGSGSTPPSPATPKPAKLQPPPARPAVWLWPATDPPAAGTRWYGILRTVWVHWVEPEVRWIMHAHQEFPEDAQYGVPGVVTWLADHQGWGRGVVDMLWAFGQALVYRARMRTVGAGCRIGYLDVGRYNGATCPGTKCQCGVVWYCQMCDRPPRKLIARAQVRVASPTFECACRRCGVQMWFVVLVTDHAVVRPACIV